MTGLKYSGPERRRFVRVPFIFPVNFKIINDDNDKVYHALSDNISEGGLKIICLDPIEKGNRVEINFHLPSEKGMNEIKCFGDIVWISEGKNKRYCGIQFLEMKNEDVEKIRNFVNRILEFRDDEVV